MNLGNSYFKRITLVHLRDNYTVSLLCISPICPRGQTCSLPALFKLLGHNQMPALKRNLRMTMFVEYINIRCM